MAMFNLFKIRTSTDIFKNEKCQVTFGLEYVCLVFVIYTRYQILYKSIVAENGYNSCSTLYNAKLH